MIDDLKESLVIGNRKTPYCGNIYAYENKDGFITILRERNGLEDEAMIGIRKRDLNKFIDTFKKIKENLKK